MTGRKKGTSRGGAKRKKGGEASAKAAAPPMRHEAVDFPVVGLGMSAGGLEALEEFIRNCPSKSGMAFVVVSHLDPNHPSMMVEILSRISGARIVQVENNMPVRPDTIYIIPPGAVMTMARGHLQLMQRSNDAEFRMPIDQFLRSLAEDQGAMAGAVILSGNGSDGTFGLEAVQDKLGLVMVQEPASAKFDSMPISALSTGFVDFVLRPSEMPEKLIQYFESVQKFGVRKVSSATKDDSSVNKILRLVRNSTGHDFSNYKHSTIVRRIERRMNLHQIGSLAQYANYLQEKPPEVRSLFMDLLVRVTRFFRDPEAFDSLKAVLMERVISSKPDGSSLRVWVPGCATGQEVYSIAIILQECMHEADKQLNVQIFGTDIDESAIETARMGTYPPNISNEMEERRLRRFFTFENDSYRVKREIRDMVIFANQNVVRDPSFSAMDLISCRNLLIYFEPVLQYKAMETFSFSLNPGGILFLGPTESINGHLDTYKLIDPKWKIYERIGYSRSLTLENLSAPLPPMRASANAIKGTEQRAVKAIDIPGIVDKILVRSYAPPSIVVNQRGEIIYFHGKTGKYIEPVSGKVKLDVQSIMREELRFQILSAMRAASKEKKEVVHGNLHIGSGKDREAIDLIVRPVPELGEIGAMLIIFKELPREEKGDNEKPAVVPDRAASYINDLEKELAAVKDSLQRTIEQLEISNGELRSSNEELQSANEELQSTNEESETAKEELRSLNEEMQSVNSELEEKNRELVRINSDMRNILNSTKVATIFLDIDLRIMRYTPEMSKIMNLIPSDIGRSVADISTKLKDDDLAQKAQRVLDKLDREETEVESLDGQWFNLRVLPYRTIDDAISGVVITFEDISGQKVAQRNLQELARKLEMAKDYAENVVDTVREPLLVLGPDLKVISANRSFFNYFRTERGEVEGHYVFDLGDGKWDIPELRKLLMEVSAKGKKFQDFAVEADFARIGRRRMLLNARKLEGEDGSGRVLLAMEESFPRVRRTP